MIRKRFPGVRIARILGWTAVVTAWATVGIRVAATEDAPPPSPVEPPAEARQQTEASLPAMPEGGLVVIRYTPDPEPEPRVVTRVVTQRVVVQSAPNPTSSGS
jgi:hypothetical protein